MRRLVTVLLVLGVVAAGCSSAVEPTDAELASLVVEAVAAECEAECSSLDVYIGEMLRSAGPRSDPPGSAAMPTEVRAALEQAYPAAEFVSPIDSRALFTNDFLVDRGRGVIVSIGQMEQLSSDVIGIEVDVTTARDGGHGGVHQFMWDGETWRSATPEETGIPEERWIS